MINAQTQDDRDELLAKPLDEKIQIAEDVIEEALAAHEDDDVLIGFTGGKDSTVTAYLVKQVCEREGYDKPAFMFVDHGQHFDAIEDFVERISDDWGFDVVTARNDDLIDQADEPGEMVPVDALNERNRREVQRLSQDYDEVPWLMDTEAGNHLLKTVAMNELLEERGTRAVINGVRWDEQEARSDESFRSPREDPDHDRIHPILPFTEHDIWEFMWHVLVPETVDGWDLDRMPRSEDDLPDGITKDDLPVSPKYWHGYRSLGSEVSTDKHVEDEPAWTQDIDNTEERAGRAQDKEEIMRKLRDLGYM